MRGGRRILHKKGGRIEGARGPVLGWEVSAVGCSWTLRIHEYSVHYIRVGVAMLKNITLSAEERLIREAREKARRENRTLNQAFREWLSQYTGAEQQARQFRRLMEELSYVRPGRKLTREEMNER